MLGSRVGKDKNKGDKGGGGEYWRDKPPMMLGGRVGKDKNEGAVINTLLRDKLDNPRLW